MSKPWPRVRLDEVLTRVERFEPRDELAEYHFAGTYSFARGIFPGERKLGASFALPRVQRIRDGDFIYCKIMAWEGAFGIAPKEVDGCVMSGAFVVYEIRRERLDPRFLDWYFKVPSHWKEVGSQSSGTNVRRQSLHPHQFEGSQIPLPPLPEQRRIVERIEELEAEITQARLLRTEATAGTEAIIGAQFGSRFSKLASIAPVRPLGEIATHILDGPHKTPIYLPDGIPGIPFVTVKNMVTGTLDFTGLQYISEDDHRVLTQKCAAEYGDVLYSKDGATRGRACFVDTHREFSFFVSVALIKPARDTLDGRYLAHFLGSNWIKDLMANRSRGDMIPHIVLREIRAFPIPVPPLSEQLRIAAECDDVQASVDDLKRVQTAASCELDALLPAILDRAFKGRL